MPIVDDRLVVGCDLENPPFASGSPEAPAGRDVEMMGRIGARMRLPIEWRKIPFAELLPALERGEVDLVCATLGITPEREERVLFTRPYFETEIAVVVRAGAGEPATFTALAGKRVGAGVGTTSERAVRRLLPRSQCLPSSKDGATSAELLLAGELDACAMDGPNADRMVAESGGRLARIREPLERERYAIAVSKQRPTLRDRVDYVLGEMQRSGALLELDAAYGL
jgi:ABC-type amino acid transport substrate-binding protein